MLRLAKSGIEIVPSSPILRRAEYASVLEAQSLVEAAREEARMIREEAEREFERQKQAGYAQGLEQGKSEIAVHLLECMSQSAAYFAKVEDVLVDVVMRALRKVLGEFDQRELVERVVHRALESTRNEGNVTIRVPPAQADFLQSRIQEVLQNFPKVQFVEVLPDSRLPEDGCVLETEIGVVDATLETQLKAIEKVLIKSMK